jgi:hypothetical protein
MDIKDTYTTVILKSKNEAVDQETIKKMRSLIWYNVREKDEGGLRLTDQGIKLVEEADIKTYKIDLPSEFKITPQILVWLDKFIDSPFYLTKKYIIVLKEKAAFELYLFSGDVRKMGYSKALAKRLSQELASE